MQRTVTNNGVSPKPNHPLPIGDSMTKNAKAYVSMLEMFIFTKHVESYGTDILTDGIALNVLPNNENIKLDNLPDGMPFGWVMRNHGTELVFANANIHNNSLTYYSCQQANARYRIDKLRRDKDYHSLYNKTYSASEPPFLYFWWDGETLMQVPSIATIFDRMRHYQDND